MAKTLVIKGANFSENKIETVTFEETIPCTGISISEQSASVDFGDNYTVLVTVTPVDTTDSIIWNSNNENFSVSNGVVTVNGVGEATITATCGEHSASMTLTATATFDSDDFDTADNMYLDFSSDIASLSKSSGKIAVGNISSTGYHSLWTDADTREVGLTFCPKPIPAGSTEMTINYTNTHRIQIGFADMTKECSSGYGAVKIVSFENPIPTAATTRTVSIPTGGNGFYASVFSDATTDKSLVSFHFE